MSYVVSWVTTLSSSCRVRLPLVLDLYRSLFMFTVSVISACVLTFSVWYMELEKFFARFNSLVLLFVASMFLLILSPSLIRILLGWDGLGLTSYLLVIYFQRPKSYNAGLLTALSNRVGDGLLLLAIVAAIPRGSWDFSVWSLSLGPLPTLVACLVIVAACTKRAQIPFSAWLPAAIAAPTPVSSLVHSSTLVTAGVYLVIRFAESLRIRGLLEYLMFVGLATTTMAGFRALWELDIKKIVALSTLRQLGLIMATVGLGIYPLAFFHLLTHAYFKALLFISVGRIIHLSSDYQDLRKISARAWNSSSTLAYGLVANLSLCGLPFTSGFQSKDLILETSGSGKIAIASFILFFGSVGLTVAYTFRFSLNLLWPLSKSPSLSWRKDNAQVALQAIAGLWPLAFAGGGVLSWILMDRPPFVLLPTRVKLAALSISIIVFFVALLGANLSPVRLSPKRWEGSTMWALSVISPHSAHLGLCRGVFFRRADLGNTPLIIMAPFHAILASFPAISGDRILKFFRRTTLLLLLSVITMVIYLRISSKIETWKLKPSCA